MSSFKIVTTSLLLVLLLGAAVNSIKLSKFEMKAARLFALSNKYLENGNRKYACAEAIWNLDKKNGHYFSRFYGIKPNNRRFQKFQENFNVNGEFKPYFEKFCGGFEEPDVEKFLSRYFTDKSPVKNNPRMKAIKVKNATQCYTLIFKTFKTGFKGKYPPGRNSQWIFDPEASRKLEKLLQLKKDNPNANNKDERGAYSCSQKF